MSRQTNRTVYPFVLQNFIEKSLEDDSSMKFCWNYRPTGMLSVPVNIVISEPTCVCGFSPTDSTSMDMHYNTNPECLQNHIHER